jgi:hypothetical protein
MAKQKAPDARLERNTADGLFAKPSKLKIAMEQHIIIIDISPFIWFI